MPVAQSKSPFQALAALDAEATQLEQNASAKREQIAKTLMEMASKFGIKPQTIVAASAKPAEKLSAKAPQKRAKSTKQTVPVKFKDPTNASNTWTGRGREPRWLAAYTSKGKSREDFRISA